MTTEAQRRASRKYYEQHKDYYREKSKESMKKIRIKRRAYENRIADTLNYLRELKSNAPDEIALKKIEEILEGKYDR